MCDRYSVTAGDKLDFFQDNVVMRRRRIRLPGSYCRAAGRAAGAAARSL